MSRAEIECIVANLIYDKKVKGYLSYAKKVVVLSAKDPFPFGSQQR